MSEGIRRVITGLDEQGKSAVLFDDRGTNSRIIWQTPAIPADNSGRDDAGDMQFTFDVFKSPGSTFLIAEFDPAQSAASLFTHATDTLDYVVVLKGRIELVLEACTVELGVGDCVVDRGVMHAWRGLGDEPAVIAVVLLPAEPVGAGATL